MKLGKIEWMVWGLIWGLFLWPNHILAQTDDQSQLQIKLRHSDGTAVPDEPIRLQRLPEEETADSLCITDGDGTCHWLVNRGLYQLLFERPLDPVSTLALAEGGLHGFGITVGDEEITYHFTLHSDGRLYFDASPEAAVPSPIIPAANVLQGGGIQPTAPPSLEIVAVAETTTPQMTTTSETAVSPHKKPPLYFLLPFGCGLLIGGLFYLWQRRQQEQSPISRPQVVNLQSPNKEDSDA